MEVGIEIVFTPMVKERVVPSSVWARILDYRVAFVHEWRMMFSADCFEIHT